MKNEGDFYMERKIVIRPERKLTNDEIERLTKKFLFLTTC